MKPKIGIFGAGWVGLVTGACFAELGHEVVVRDVLPDRIEALQAGRVPFHEPGVDELLERNRERLTFTLDLDEVVIRDVVPERIEALQAGRVPFHEPGVEELLERNRERLTFTHELDDLVDTTVLFVCVGTPPTYSGDADLSAVWMVVDELPQVDRRIVVAMKSTVPVGTGRTVRHRLD